MTDKPPDYDTLADALTISPEILSAMEGPLQEVLQVALDQMIIDVTSGDPATKTAVMKIVAPLFMKAKREAESQGEDIEKIREEVRDMFTQAGKELGPRVCPHCGERAD